LVNKLQLLTTSLSAAPYILPNQKHSCALLLLLLQQRLGFTSEDEQILLSNITPAKVIADKNLEQHVSHGMYVTQIWA
jgi:hypothetical protein